MLISHHRPACFRAMVFGIAMVIEVTHAVADPVECNEAIRGYNSAISDVSPALRAYANCVSDSRGVDDCSSEFSLLQSAQDDFETAVSQHQIECP